MEQLVFTHATSVPKGALADIEAELNQLNVPVRSEEQELPGFYASVEWALATAVFLWIAKPYFNSFLSEAGRHHYDVLKRVGAKAWDHFWGNEPEYKYELTDRTGQAKPSKYSLTFSVMSEMPDGLRIKLLIEQSAERDQVGEAVAVFFRELSHYQVTGNSRVLTAMVENGPPTGGIYLVAVDPQTQNLIEIDILPPEVRARINRAREHE